MTLTDFQAMVCFLIGAGSVTVVWTFVSLVNWKDHRK